MTDPNGIESVAEAISSSASAPQETEPGPVLTSTPQQTPGPPEGFGGTVNSYLNTYVSVADAKAAGFLAAALTVGATTVRLRPTSVWGWAFYCLAVVLLGAAGCAGAIAIFPRLPRVSDRGLIFWEEIRGWSDVAAYQQALAQLRAQDVESAYAAQNRIVSEVLHRKHLWIRWSVGLFMVGTAAAVIAYWIVRHA